MMQIVEGLKPHVLVELGGRHFASVMTRRDVKHIAATGQFHTGAVIVDEADNQTA
jgi:DNA integrity scanning protein DisA with diadenylate cyclase activity